MATAISADGRTVVGFARDTVDGKRKIRPFRWTEEEGMQDLGYFPDGSWTRGARAVSADGTVIVGTTSPWGNGRAFMWDAEHGLRFLLDVLEDEYRLDLSKWPLLDVFGISDDGRTIVGYGYEKGNGASQGWVAHIGHISSGDANCDHDVNFDDIDPFVLALTDPDQYNAQYGETSDIKYADINGDGAVDFNDIDPFVECLINGACP
jgi:uncharacterized membrane protein